MASKLPFEVLIPYEEPDRFSICKPEGGRIRQFAGRPHFCFFLSFLLLITDQKVRQLDERRK